MVERLRCLMGRTEIRLLVLLVCGILLAGLAVSIAQLTKTSSDLAAPTVSSWDELLKGYLLFREFNYPLVVPDECLPYGELEATLEKYTLGELEKQPGWYWNFSGGTFCFEADSELAKQLGESADLVVYEDMENGEILILRVPESESEDYREEIVYRAPEWPETAKSDDTETYLWRELSKRRIAWQVTLKTRKLAEEEESAEESEPQLLKTSGEDLLLRFGEDYTNHLWLSVEGQNHGLTNVVVGVHVPDGFTNRLEVFAITNLLSFPWSMVETNLSADGTNVVYWADPAQDDWEACFYTVGNADSDTDEDGINDAREKFLYGTDPQNWDTDGDGASDGDEISASTDPLNNPGDADGDGLSDDLEIVLGTDPDEADTDLDWAGDGYELEWGFNPLDPSNTPPRRMILDDGSQYTRSTNITVSLPGMVAEHIIIGETPDLTNGVLYTFSQQLEYGLQNESNGVRTLYARLYRDTVVQSPLINESVIFDNVAPAISELSPTNGASTDQRWILVSGVVTDTYSAVQVFIDGQWSDGVTSEGLFQYDRYLLSSGTNAIVITAKDKAGNIATQQLDVVQDTSGDTTPPSIALILPRDFEVDGGVTNWLDQTTFGTNEVLYVQGVTDDETADVRFLVHADGQTSGPSPAIVVGTQVWGAVQLFPGTNLLEALASDAAGNTATSTWVVIRDTNFFFEITSPVAYQQMNSPSVTVYGVASPAFLPATITVNGVETAITNQGTHVSFATLFPVPLNVGRTEIGALAMLDGRSYYADPQVYGYEVRKCHRQYDSTFDYRSRIGGSYVTEIGWQTSVDEWDVDAKIWTVWDSWGYDICVYSGAWNCSPYYGSDVWSWPLERWQESARFGKRIYTRDDYSDDETGWLLRSQAEARYSDTLTFVKHWPTQELQTVILYFQEIHYDRDFSMGPFNPSLITYREQPGFWYNGHPAFVVSIKTETEYIISESDFTWPSFYRVAPQYTPPYIQEGQFLHLYGWFSNSQLNVEMTRPDDKAARRYFHLVFNDESPGVCNVTCKTRITPDTQDVRDHLTNKVSWSIDAVQGASLSWQNGGISVYYGGEWEEKAIFTGLPASNDVFGIKNVTVALPGGASQAGKAKIFYARDEKNHPGDGAGTTPNWYYYWSQTPANFGSHEYYGPGSPDGRSYTAFIGGQWRARIADDVVTGPIVLGGITYPKGIDNFALLTRHEEQHRIDMIALWGVSSGRIAADDLDGDYLPDEQEANLVPGRPYDPLLSATYPDTWGYGVGWRDVEDYALIRQNFPTPGDYDSVDWSFPGKQWDPAVGDPNYTEY